MTSIESLKNDLDELKELIGRETEERKRGNDNLKSTLTNLLKKMPKPKKPRKPPEQQIGKFVIKFNLDRHYSMLDTHTYVACSTDSEFKKFIKDLGGQWSGSVRDRSLGRLSGTYRNLGCWRIPDKHSKDIVSLIKTKFPAWSGTDQRKDGLEMSPHYPERYYRFPNGYVTDFTDYQNLPYHPDYPQLVRETWYYFNIADWYKSAKVRCLSRVNGPAVRHWSYNGDLLLEKWYKSGKLHRSDGPAIRRWNGAGDLTEQGWYWDGESLTQEQVQRTVLLLSVRDKVLRASRLLALSSAMPAVPDDILSVVGEFLRPQLTDLSGYAVVCPDSDSDSDSD